MSPTRLTLLALALGALCLGGCRRAERQPPIVFVSIDTLRADHLPDWGYAGGRTPRISELARTSIRFENAYSQVPLTFPSHSSLLTGLLPPNDGVRSNIGYRFEAAAAQASLPATLAAAGYATGGFVSSYVLRRETGLAAAFEAYDDAMEVYEQATLGSLQRPGTVTVAAALRWLETLPPERPYFLFVHLFEPHFPYEPPAAFRDLPNPYDGEIAAADAALGPLFDALAARGDLDRALVALFSDHGEGLGEHGEKEHGILLYRTTLHVPLLLKLPGGRRGGEVVRAPAALVDLFPSVVEVARVEPPPALAGRSLLTLGEGDAGRRIYSETLYPRLHLGWSQLRSLVDGRWHAIEGPDPELYDVAADPHELSNLRGTARREYAERAAELAAMPLEFEPPAPASAEEMAKLAALGYLGGTSDISGDGPLLDPKAHMAVLDAVQRSFTLTSEGRYEEALDLCYRLLAENPNLIDARNQLAGVLRKLGRFEEALEVYVETERRFPQFGESLAIERAKVELDLGRLDRAEAEARRALVANPLEAHLVLSAIAGRRSDWPRAIDEARAAIGAPDRPRVPALLLLAQAYLAQDRLDAALAEAERAAEATRRPGAAPVPTVDSTYGDILARLGRDAEAEAAFRREIAHFPKSPEPYTRLAILLAAEHRFDEIEPTLEALVAANPTPQAFVAAAETMERLGNVEGAARYRAGARAADRELARTAASGR